MMIMKILPDDDDDDVEEEEGEMPSMMTTKTKLTMC